MALQSGSLRCAGRERYRGMRHKLLSDLEQERQTGVCGSWWRRGRERVGRRGMRSGGGVGGRAGGGPAAPGRPRREGSAPPTHAVSRHPWELYCEVSQCKGHCCPHQSPAVPSPGLSCRRVCPTVSRWSRVGSTGPGFLATGDESRTRCLPRFPDFIKLLSQGQIQHHDRLHGVAGTQGSCVRCMGVGWNPDGSPLVERRTAWGVGKREREETPGSPQLVTSCGGLGCAPRGGCL